MTADPAVAASAPALRAEGLTKSFGATRALRSASLEVLPGEVHAVIGENGSGKSTLVKILAGVHRPDSGRVDVAGRAVSRWSPQAAIGSGVVAVFQEALVVPARSVTDNIWLGGEPLRGISKPQRKASAAEVLSTLLDPLPDLDAPVGSFPLSDRQACCVARALRRGPRVLILDEATSALDVATRQRLFATLRELTTGGTAVVFISHRMDEIVEIADRVTVMRSGETVATLPRAQATTDALITLMTGERHGVLDQVAPRVSNPGPVVLAVSRIRLRPSSAPIDFTLRAGEIVGLAGLEGHGQDRFLDVLRDRDRGCAYVPRDRRSDGLFEPLSVRENFALPTLRRDQRLGLLSSRRTERRLAPYAERLGIRMAQPGAPISTLSGGNQQKVVIARWLAADPTVLLLNDPTRGIDLPAKRDVYRLLGSVAAEGMAIVMMSTEVDEHVALMDRVLVFREHTVYRELDGRGLTRERLVTAYFGQPDPSGGNGRLVQSRQEET